MLLVVVDMSSVKRIAIGWLSVLVALLCTPALLAAEAAEAVSRADSLMAVLAERIALSCSREFSSREKSLASRFLPFSVLLPSLSR